MAKTETIHANYISAESIKAAGEVLRERRKAARDKQATPADRKTTKES